MAPAPPWKRHQGIDSVLQRWKTSGQIRACMVAEHEFAAEQPRLAPFPEELAPGLKQALLDRKITALYEHQRLAYEGVRAGKHLAIATPTASGKSLCFHLPILQRLVEDPDARCLYLFPTKALSRDQETQLQAFVRSAGFDFPAVVYDGDTPGDIRRASRERVPLLLTNPDMLHAGILPHHAQWARTFQNLAYVVLDEVHTYRGVFGSHMAHVVARLKRIAEFHGSKPQFLCASATIGNVAEHTTRLLGISEDELCLVDKSGAPRGKRKFYLYNPPVINQELGLRASSLKSAVRLAGDLVAAKVPTLVFGPSRNSVEIVLKYLRERCHKHTEPSAVMAYRGGYLPKKRRQIEAELRSGKIIGVVATNALELGIDIGELDAVICLGYPGSIASMWQRFGRAGRRSGQSVAVLVASSSPLNQYLARKPGFLLEQNPEEARLDPGNAEILVPHLRCAAFELPFEDGERFGELTAVDTTDAMDYLQDHGVVHRSGDRYHWASESYPANSVSLRRTGWDNFVIIDQAREKTIAELDWRATHTMLHEQAIYQHDGEQYQVERLDFDNHKAYVKKVQPDFYTEAMTHRAVNVLEECASAEAEFQAAGLAKAMFAWGEVSVIEKVVGFKKIKYYTHENTGYGDVHLPEMQMHTTSFWMSVPEAVCTSLGVGRAAAIDGLRGISIAFETCATLALLCEGSDLSRSLGDKSDGASPAPPEKAAGKGPRPGFDPTLFLYDAHPGGVGLAERIYEKRHQLLEQVVDLVSSCDCEQGCPACVGPGETEGPGRKGVGLMLLRALGYGWTKKAANDGG